MLNIKISLEEEIERLLGNENNEESDDCISEENFPVGVASSSEIQEKDDDSGEDRPLSESDAPDSCSDDDENPKKKSKVSCNVYNFRLFSENFCFSKRLCCLPVPTEETH